MACSPLVTLVSAMVCTSSLTDGLLDIFEQLGRDALDFQMMVVNDVNSGAISREAVVARLRASDVILIDIRGNNPATEIIVEQAEFGESKGGGHSNELPDV